MQQNSFRAWKRMKKGRNTGLIPWFQGKLGLFSTWTVRRSRLFLTVEQFENAHGQLTAVNRPRLPSLPGIICPGWTAWSARDDLHDLLGTICMIYLGWSAWHSTFNKLHEMHNVARIMGPWWSHNALWIPWVVSKNIWKLLRAKTGYSSSI